MPAFVVFTDATLASIAERMPADLPALARISGVGAVKLERYGAGVLGALRAANIEMGRDVSVIAGCATDPAQSASPPDPAIPWDVRAWGATAAELLLDRIRNGEREAGRQVTLPCELIVRSSCAAPNEAFACH